MKTLKTLLLAIVSMFVLTGCFSGSQQGFVRKTPTTHDWGSWKNSPSMPVGQSELPSDPVRNHSFTYSDGTVYYNHREGTDNYFSHRWDEYGPQRELRQSTYNETTFTRTPDRRHRGAYWDQIGRNSDSNSE